jgi:FixJ family two-component response regulator
MTPLEESMMVEHALVSVVDDDVSVRESLPCLLRELGYAAAAFSSAEEFLASDSIGQTECLLLDIAMPGMSGPDLHSELTLQGRNMPVIYITGGADPTACARLLKRGATECLRKPFSDEALLRALNVAFQGSRTIT